MLETWEVIALAILAGLVWLGLAVYAMATSGEDPFDTCPPNCPECRAERRKKSNG